uniref:Uncharacterized protein n=1 Tax=Romanomermis culicivorax TaxID=13658 RepID=A0A915ILN9_ROMCU
MARPGGGTLKTGPPTIPGKFWAGILEMAGAGVLKGFFGISILVTRPKASKTLLTSFSLRSKFLKDKVH